MTKYSTENIASFEEAGNKSWAGPGSVGVRSFESYKDLSSFEEAGCKRFSGSGSVMFRNFEDSNAPHFDALNKSKYASYSKINTTDYDRRLEAIAGKITPHCEVSKEKKVELPLVKKNSFDR